MLDFTGEGVIKGGRKEFMINGRLGRQKLQIQVGKLVCKEALDYHLNLYRNTFVMAGMSRRDPFPDELLRWLPHWSKRDHRPPPVPEMKYSRPPKECRSRRLSCQLM